MRVDPVQSRRMLQRKEILAAALALDPPERARLAHELLESLDEPVEVDPELAADLRRRIEEIESGEVEAIPWSEVKARIGNRRKPR